MAELLLSAFSDEFCEDFSGQIKAMKKLGVEYIEIRFVNNKNISVLSDEEIDTCKRLLEKYNVKIASIGSPIGKIKLTDDFNEHIKLCKRVFEIANKLEVKNVRIFSFYLPEGSVRSECKKQVIERLERILLLADRYNVILCHENEARIYGESPENCVEILSHFDGRIRAVFDMGNFVLDGYKPYPDAYEKLFPYIEYFHIKDSLYKGAIVPAGKGEAKIKEILCDYKIRGKKNAFITLEPHLETFSGLNSLVGKNFENPYKFASTEESFTVALKCLREICNNGE